MIFDKLAAACLSMRSTLKWFLFSRILGVAMVVFVIVLLTATVLYDKLLAQQARETAAGIAGQTYAAIAALMPFGPTRDELLAVIDGIKEAHRSSPYRIEIYRSGLIDAQYGPIEQGPVHDGILRVLQSGKPETNADYGRSQHLFPLLAGESCLGCHVNARPETVLGVVAVSQSLKDLVAEMRLGYLGLFLFYGLLIAALVLGVTWLVVSRVSLALDMFREKTADINSVSDLSAIGEIADARFSFSELDLAFAAVGELAERLRDVAIDKDILEFEIRILNKFIITSNVVQDWQLFVKELLVDINAVIDTYALLAFFQEGEEEYELDIFWRCEPSDLIREQMEKIVRQQIYSSFQLAGDSPAVAIVHHNAGSDVPLPQAIDFTDIEVRTKSIFLDAPKVGGIVGIGVQSSLVVDPIYHIILDSVLATLLNLVGSVKAIYKYTKDLEYYATRDPLTFLHNQRMFWEMLGYEVGRAERHGYPFALLVIDMDNFKNINDRYGHGFGDAFLHQFAETLRHSVRDGDFVARYGGDEFIVLLPETAREQAHAVACRIVVDISTLGVMAADGARVTTTVSIGMAMYPDHGKTARDLFMVADNMMYKVKSAGKNAIAAPEMEDVAEIFKNEGEMNILVYQALEQQTLLPHFQAIFDFETGQPYAHELLMRIPAADGRVLSAVDFIKAAERIGLINKLDLLLVEKAFIAANEQDYQGRLFINISPKAFIAPDFITRLQALTRKFDIDPGRVVFEVTERDTVSNIAMLQKFAALMKNDGFKFAVDDFGSGYSSFKYLKLFPIDYIKIEGDFIRNLERDADYQAYVKSIVTLARELEIKTVAEQVEDEGAFAAASRLGIDYWQGFYLGRPAESFRK